MDEQLDNITAEFLDYRSTPDDQLPSFNINDDAAIEVFWHMSKITGISEQRFGHLAQLCEILTVLPHANADPERLFSMVNKVETEQRSSLHASTVQDLTSVKVNVSQPCYDTGELFTPDLLKSARSATHQS